MDKTELYEELLITIGIEDPQKLAETYVYCKGILKDLGDPDRISFNIALDMYPISGNDIIEAWLYETALEVASSQINDFDFDLDKTDFSYDVETGKVLAMGQPYYPGMFSSAPVQGILSPDILTEDGVAIYVDDIQKPEVGPVSLACVDKEQQPELFQSLKLKHFPEWESADALTQIHFTARPQTALLEGWKLFKTITDSNGKGYEKDWELSEKDKAEIRTAVRSYCYSHDKENALYYDDGLLEDVAPLLHAENVRSFNKTVCADISVPDFAKAAFLHYLGWNEQDKGPIADNMTIRAFYDGLTIKVKVGYCDEDVRNSLEQDMKKGTIPYSSEQIEKESIYDVLDASFGVITDNKMFGTLLDAMNSNLKDNGISLTVQDIHENMQTPKHRGGEER